MTQNRIGVMRDARLLWAREAAMIKLSDIWPVERPEDYKLHFARQSDAHQPLDVFVRDRREWQGWQEYRPERDEFNRPHVFALMQFYHEADTWLFGGVYDVITRHPKRYEVALSEVGNAFIGRLKLRAAYKTRTARVNFENHYPELEVAEILREPYSGRSFPGYEDIALSFEELETIVRNERPDWKAALESVKGIYLITDASTGKRYVGSAYGDSGIWSRWTSYVFSGHGGNVELRALVSDPSLNYCRQHFRFALLEHRPRVTADEAVLAREAHWKRLLFTRGDEGLNRN
jgi:hypothetical protein